MAQDIHDKNHCNYWEGRGIHNYGSYQTKYKKYGSGMGISLGQNMLKPFSLSSHIYHHHLYSPDNAPQSISSCSRNIRGFGIRECVDFFIQFIWVNEYMGVVHVHVGQLSGTEMKFPYANQEHVEEHSRQNELQVLDENQEKDIHQNNHYMIFSKAYIVEPMPYCCQSNQNVHYVEEIFLTIVYAPHRESTSRFQHIQIIIAYHRSF